MTPQATDSPNSEEIPLPLEPSPSLRLRFPREARVRRGKEFDLAFSTGTRSSTAAMLILARENGLDLARIGISTGRRFGKAHQRNRIKRLLREAFRLDRSLFPIGYDFIVVPRSDGIPNALEPLRRLFLEGAKRAVKGPRNRPRPVVARRKKRRR